MLKNIICNGVLSTLFPASMDVSKEPLYRAVATELIKKLKYEPDAYDDAPAPKERLALLCRDA